MARGAFHQRYFPTADTAQQAREYIKDELIWILEDAMSAQTKQVTLFLSRAREGNQDAVNQLVPLLYAELRRLAASYLRRERSDHTLQPTALVHEAYLKLVDQDVQWQNRNHFFGVAAQVMRRILVDHARGHQAAKRGGAVPKLSLDQAIIYSPERSGELLALDEILQRLAQLEAQQARIVELRVFGGLTVEQAAQVLGISPATVKRDWSLAKAWLARELRKDAKGSETRGAA
jgi:RNA polymerase sigma-70 factor, ECF subfamily